MARNTYGNVGYEAGKQCPFTPATGAKWIPAFNQKLEALNNESGVSRNKLTNLLLEKALDDELENNSVKFDCSDLNDTEIQLLKSENVQAIIKKMIRDMASVSTTLASQAITVEKQEITNNREVSETLLNQSERPPEKLTDSEPVRNQSDEESEAFKEAAVTSEPLQKAVETNSEPPSEEKPIVKESQSNQNSTDSIGKNNMNRSAYDRMKRLRSSVK